MRGRPETPTEASEDAAPREDRIQFGLLALLVFVTVSSLLAAGLSGRLGESCQVALWTLLGPLVTAVIILIPLLTLQAGLVILVWKVSQAFIRNDEKR